MKNGCIRFLTVLTLATLLPAVAMGQSAPYECDDNFQQCGSPQQSGGGGGGGGGGSILVNNTDLGDTYQYADDYDNDGIEDPYDNCRFTDNPDQVDDDGDGVGSACDDCPGDYNPQQEDLDGDGQGDVCDPDQDGDAIQNEADDCPRNPDPQQKDTDGDKLGDACDPDMDDDGVSNLEDNCPLVANPDQSNEDPDIWGNACDADDDSDSIRNTYDNCPSVANGDQLDGDGDGLGDACDADVDADGVINALDNCAKATNADQSDLDRDGLGDVCDPRFCYVVLGDVEHCLDPSDAFTLVSPPLTTQTGQPVRLRLFANRTNQPLRYTWEVLDAPRGSDVDLLFPIGAASISTSYEYHYLADRVVTFSARQPGEYQVRVTAELVWPDVVTGQAGVMAQTTAWVRVEGEAIGCSSRGGRGSPAGLWLPALFVLAGAGISTRRRRAA